MTENIRPNIVELNASVMVRARAAGSAPPVCFKSPNARIIPIAVPAKPIIGGTMIMVIETQMERFQYLILPCSSGDGARSPVAGGEA